MSSIHLIGGEKGGVGKSVTARLIAQYHIDHQLPLTIYDADRSHGAMVRYYSDYTQPLDLTRFEEADQLIEQSLEKGVTALVDLPAQSFKLLQHWIEEIGLIDFASENGLSLVFWHILDDGADSLQLLETLLHTYGKNAQYVIVRNFGRGGDFTAFAHSEAAHLAQAYHAKIVDLPPLHPPVMRKIDHAHASFWSAAHNSQSELGPVLGLLERQRVKIWLNKAYSPLREIF